MSAVPPKAPKAEANRLSMLLNASLGQERFPVNVTELAKGYAKTFGHDDPIDDVVSDDLPGFEGALYSTEKNGKNCWAIIYNSNIVVPGRIRFTLAHELGHYILHRYGEESFECSEDDMLRWDSVEKQIEAEADVFASYLLMPIDDFQRQVRGDQVDLEVLNVCAKRYGVSLTAAVLKWLEFTEQRAVLVMSRDGYILWAHSSQSAYKSGVFFKTRGRAVQLPSQSLAVSDPGTTLERQGVELPARTWFPREPKEMSLREMKIVSDKYEQTLSLLILPKAEPRWFRDPMSKEETSGTDD
jgi:hypothetical protein